MLWNRKWWELTKRLMVKSPPQSSRWRNSQCERIIILTEDMILIYAIQDNSNGLINFQRVIRKQEKRCQRMIPQGKIKDLNWQEPNDRNEFKFTNYTWVTNHYLNGDSNSETIGLDVKDKHISNRQSDRSQVSFHVNLVTSRISLVVCSDRCEVSYKISLLVFQL